MGVKLSKRLKRIESMITKKYDHIWDCCCDHGLLGQALLEREHFVHIHFVDIVSKLMERLQENLEKSYKEISSRWSVHCCHVADIPLPKYSGKHLIIISGVGGDLTKTFMSSLCNQYPEADIDYILCPVYHQFDLRKELIRLDFVLQDECLIRENKRYYEIMMVSKKLRCAHEYEEICPVGNKIWQYTNEEEKNIATEYLNKIYCHYKKQQHSKTHFHLEAFSQYKNVSLQKKSLHQVEYFL